MPDVLITGAARGLGRATAEFLGARGWRVAATDLTAPDVGDLRLAMDVTDEASCAAAAEEVARAFGGLDGLVNNAGIPHAGSVAATPPAIGRAVLDVNLAGPYVVTNSMLRLLHPRRGRVVVIGSEAARFPQGFSLYAVSKIGVEAWAGALRQELMLERMHVSVVRPGAHRTALLDEVAASMRARAADPILGRWLGRVARIAEGPLSKGADPDAVAEAVHRALTDRRPRRTYPVNNDIRLRLAQALPARARDRLTWLIVRLTRERAQGR